MHGYLRRSAITGLLLIMMILACNYPSATSTQDMMATQVAETLTAVGVAALIQQVSTQQVSTVRSTTTPVPSNTNLPSPTTTPGNPVVIHDALCLVGPGDVYEVVSSVRNGTTVELIGVGSLPGWYIINNPIYHNPCWIAAANLKIDPGYNLSALRVFNPPFTPTPVPTESPIPTT